MQTTGGGITKVLTGPGTTIRVTTTGTVKNLAPGTPVVVQGVRAADGTVQATGITQGATAAAAGRSASTPATPGG